MGGPASKTGPGQKSLLSFFGKPKPTAAPGSEKEKAARSQQEKEAPRTPGPAFCLAPAGDSPEPTGRPLKRAAPDGSHEDRREKMRRVIGDAAEISKPAYRAVDEKFKWLSQEHIKDKNGRKPNHPEYDARTVSVPAEKRSPSQQQFWEVKRQYMDVVMFFKVGSFYEIYCDDAMIGATVLGIKMTVSGVGGCRQCGVPETGIESAVTRLVAAGYRVGRIEQMETSAEAKLAGRSVVRRELLRIVSPSAITPQDGPPLPADSVHLLALCEEEGEGTQGGATFGFAFLDAAAGKIFLGSCRDDATRGALGALLAQVDPKEVVYTKHELSVPTSRLLSRLPSSPALTTVPAGDGGGGDARDAVDGLRRSAPWGEGGEMGWPDAVRRAVGLWEGGGADRSEAGCALRALASVLRHLRRLKVDGELCRNADVLRWEVFRGALKLDGPTVANLELLEDAEGGNEGSLLRRLDHCATPGGRRLLRRWLCRPSRSPREISRRLDAVDALVERQELAGSVARGLRRVGDVDRALGRLMSSAAPPREGLPGKLVVSRQGQRLSALREAAGVLGGAMDLLRELGVSCDGWDAPALLTGAAAALPSDEAGGPAESVSRVVDAIRPPGKDDRHPTLRASAVERLVEAPSERGEVALEDEVVATTMLAEGLLAYRCVWSAMADAVAEVDVMHAFAQVSATSMSTGGPMCRPMFLPEDSGRGAVLDLRGVWHPCAVAGAGQGGLVVPNDVCLGGESAARAMVVTGPNMGGKSTVLRASCIAVVLAHMGCHVPAESCELTPADTVFTRIGASDRIMNGESTFMVECLEASSILRHATDKSVVVMDELGRGTATFDGYSIASAVLRHMSQVVKCRLMFATHYYHLTQELAGSPHVSMRYMACLVRGGADAGGEDKEGNEASSSSLVFLFRLLQGASPRSYGLQVASLAGIPRTVLRRASIAAAGLEERVGGAFARAAGCGALGPWQLSALRSAHGGCAQSPVDDEAALRAAWESLRSPRASS